MSGQATALGGKITNNKKLNQRKTIISGRKHYNVTEGLLLMQLRVTLIEIKKTGLIYNNICIQKRNREEAKNSQGHFDSLFHNFRLFSSILFCFAVLSKVDIRKYGTEHMTHVLVRGLLCRSLDNV